MTERAEQFHGLFLALRIEEQRVYYTERSREYRKAHEQAVIVRNVLLLGAAVAGGIGPFVPDRVRAILGVVGAVLGALAAAVTAFETLIGFPQLEKIYGDAARNLEEAKLDWQDLDPDTMSAAEFERVEDVFRSERGQWGQLVVKSPAQAPPPAGEPRRATVPLVASDGASRGPA